MDVETNTPKAQVGNRGRGQVSSRTSTTVAKSRDALLSNRQVRTLLSARSFGPNDGKKKNDMSFAESEDHKWKLAETRAKYGAIIRDQNQTATAMKYLKALHKSIVRWQMFWEGIDRTCKLKIIYDESGKANKKAVRKFKEGVKRSIGDYIEYKHVEFLEKVFKEAVKNLEKAILYRDKRFRSRKDSEDDKKKSIEDNTKSYAVVYLDPESPVVKALNSMKNNKSVSKYFESVDFDNTIAKGFACRYTLNYLIRKIYNSDKKKSLFTEHKITTEISSSKDRKISIGKGASMKVKLTRYTAEEKSLFKKIAESKPLWSYKIENEKLVPVKGANGKVVRGRFAIKSPGDDDTIVKVMNTSSIMKGMDEAKYQYDRAVTDRNQKKKVAAAKKYIVAEILLKSDLKDDGDKSMKNHFGTSNTVSTIITSLITYPAGLLNGFATKKNGMNSLKAKLDSAENSNRYDKKVLTASIISASGINLEESKEKYDDDLDEAKKKKKKKVSPTEIIFPEDAKKIKEENKELKDESEDESEDEEGGDEEQGDEEADDDDEVNLESESDSSDSDSSGEESEKEE